MDGHDSRAEALAQPRTHMDPELIRRIGQQLQYQSPLNEQLSALAHIAGHFGLLDGVRALNIRADGVHHVDLSPLDCVDHQPPVEVEHYTSNRQLMDIVRLANRFGLYDAVDYIRTSRLVVLEPQPGDGATSAPRL